MNLRQQFAQVTSGTYNITPRKTSWRVEGNTLYLQCTRENEDWFHNFLIIPAIVVIRGKPILTTLGWALLWWEFLPILDAHPNITTIVGYSLGSVLATFSSAHTQQYGVCFASPKCVRAFHRSLFNKCHYIHNPKDIVTKNPPHLTRYGTRTLLTNHIERPDSIPLLDWKTHHTAYEIRAQLAKENI